MQDEILTLGVLMERAVAQRLRRQCSDINLVDADGAAVVGGWRGCYFAGVLI